MGESVVLSKNLYQSVSINDASMYPDTFHLSHIAIQFEGRTTSGKGILLSCDAGSRPMS